MQNKENRKPEILIVKLGAIGDVVMASAIVQAAKNEFPNARITWMCGKIVEPILIRIKSIDNVIVIDDFKLFKGSMLEKLSVIFNANKSLFGKHYDLILTPYRDSRYNLLSFFAKANSRRNFNGSDKLNSFVPGRYHANEYVKLFHGSDDFSSVDVEFPKIDLEEDKEIDKIFIDSAGKYVAITPGGAKNLLNEDTLRSWPVENYKTIAEKLLQLNYKVILLGAKSDEWILPWFKEMDVINLVGTTSIPQLMNVLSRINLLISHDTGIFHLGKLFRTPTIVLFGPVNPAERVSKKEAISVITSMPLVHCSPCYDGKHFADCNNNICMKNITINQVMEETKKLINN